MAKSVGQDDLRKMMQKIKSTKNTSNNSNNPRLKKYKLSNRELQVRIDGQNLKIRIKSFSF